MKLKPIVALIISMILIINIGISFAESTNSWDCNVCGNKNNTGNFCPNCAAAKPNDEAWTCDVCQQTGNTGNYCTNCAAAKPSGEAWTCNVCQQSGNTGNYCVNCGSSRILKLPAVVNYSVGSKVYFGNYPQRLNNPEPILWKILDIKGNKALLMSAYGLDSVQYHPVATNITWEHCFLRSWLNNNFLNAAFSNEERTAILKTLVLNEENIFYPNTPAGANTEDYVFI
ncbi:MAG: hypothetical protein GYA87_02780, partial [Christensenellaceae bacterium]|nr:hypothetical protein [Christensenellaceae bacterium]